MDNQEEYDKKYPKEFVSNIDIKTEQWQKLLKDSKVFYEKDIEILKKIYQFNNYAATCYELGIQDGVSPFSYISPVVYLAKRISKALSLEPVLGNDGKRTWWRIPFWGRYRDSGHFEWKIRPELVKAMQNVYPELDPQGLNEQKDNLPVEQLKKNKYNGKFIEDKNESLYQEMIRRNTISDKEDDGDSVLEPVQKPEAIVDKGGRLSWPRNASIAAKAILRADYQCEYNPSLPVFTSKITGQSFMEAHHLVPMSLQEVFDVSLDRVDNIICLCPHVHRLIHHAVDDEREEVLEKLFKQRSEKLKKVGIHISLYDLKKAYSIKTNNL